ncbi:MAG: hypothetical protein RMJ36_05475 [Candidatus Calescibacterium sp.]|nr:hypothetical protein [Candidatus Calescibacterium sp.]MDW8133086.1 hypothetical protein [Candidatus Calescibacterium sp.]
MKREIPLIITALTGIIIIINYFLPEVTGKVTQVVRNWVIVISSFAIILGILNLVIISLRKTLEPITHLDDRIANLILIVSLVFTIVIGMIYGVGPKNNYVFKLSSDYSTVLPLIDFQVATVDTNIFNSVIFYSIYNPLSAAMFSLLAFFIASASYRAFRARNLEATLLLLAAAVVILGRVPVGDYVFGFIGLKISVVSEYITAVINAAAQRAILIAVGIGTIIISLKLLFGIEKSHIGKSE